VLTEDIGEREIKDGAPGSTSTGGGKTNTGSGQAAGKVRGDSPAVALTPKPGQANVAPITWDRFEMVDSNTVRVYFMSGVEPCSVLDSVKVVYAKEIIRIAIYMGSDPTQQDAVCPALARLAYTDVDLTEPVGEREIVDDQQTD
jgi:hypothetical protein